MDEVKLALQMNKLVHNECKNVPHDIGLRLLEIVKQQLHHREQEHDECSCCVSMVKGECQKGLIGVGKGARGVSCAELDYIENYCKIDRRPIECSIYVNTKGGCDGCGHKILTTPKQ